MTAPETSDPRGWRALWQRHRTAMRVVWGSAIILLVADGALLGRTLLDVRETTALRARLSNVERERIDAALHADSNRAQVLVELARRQARIDNGLHLSVAVDSAVAHLEQEGAVLMSVAVTVGPDSWIRTGPRDSVRLAAPRGERTIADVYGDTLVVLSGGTVVYADSSGAGARPGQVRVSLADLKLLKPNLRPGQRVYFY